jgi:hypothetical protein
MKLALPSSLHYPITITKLLKQPNDEVERFAPLFSYSYKTTVTEGNEFGEEKQVEKSFPSQFESPTEGTLIKWLIQPGTPILRRLAATIFLGKIEVSGCVLTAAAVPLLLKLTNHAHMRQSFMAFVRSVGRMLPSEWADSVLLAEGFTDYEILADYPIILGQPQSKHARASIWSTIKSD